MISGVARTPVLSLGLPQAWKLWKDRDLDL
jgi:hypothetical protein